MDSLFSHGDNSTTPTPEGKPPSALTAEVTVPRSQDEAFAGFTDGIHLWWPANQTRFGEGTHPEFTGGELFEEDESGNTALWATVSGAHSESEVILAWHHQGNPNLSSTVAVAFAAESGGTRVTVVHDGWAAGVLGREQHASAPDWPTVLAGYRRFMGGQA